MKSISISAKAIFSATLFSVGLFISAKASALPAQLFFECAANLKEEISVTVVTDAEEFNNGFHDLAATVQVFENGVLKFSTSSATIGERLPVLVDDGQILWAMDVAVDAAKEESIQMGFDPVSESWYLGVNAGGVILDPATSVGSVSCRVVDDSGLAH